MVTILQIISDVIKSMENDWLNQIKLIFFSEENQDKWWTFYEDYREKPYEKNVIGSMKELVRNLPKTNFEIFDKF